MAKRSPVVIKDEFGHEWVVAPSDPAAELIKSLKYLGYTYIALPAAVLTSGDPSREWPLSEDQRYKELKGILNE